MLITAGIVLFDFACTVLSGAHSMEMLLDLTTLEENDVPHLTVASMPRSGKVTLVTLETRVHADCFEVFRLVQGVQGRPQGNAACRQTADGRPRSCHARCVTNRCGWP